MADISVLTDKTIELKPKLAPHVGWPLAAVMAVEKTGIRNKSDVQRLSGQIVTELKKRGIVSYTYEERRERARRVASRV